MAIILSCESREVSRGLILISQYSHVFYERWVVNLVAGVVSIVESFIYMWCGNLGLALGGSKLKLRTQPLICFLLE